MTSIFLLFRVEVHVKEPKRKSPENCWEELENRTKQEKQNERKIRKAGHFAVVGIPILSVSFIVLFFVIGFSYSFANS